MKPPLNLPRARAFLRLESRETCVLSCHHIGSVFHAPIFSQTLYLCLPPLPYRDPFILLELNWRAVRRETGWFPYVGWEERKRTTSKEQERSPRHANFWIEARAETDLWLRRRRFRHHRTVACGVQVRCDCHCWRACNRRALLVPWLSATVICVYSVENQTKSGICVTVTISTASNFPLRLHLQCTTKWRLYCKKERTQTSLIWNFTMLWDWWQDHRRKTGIQYDTLICTVVTKIQYTSWQIFTACACWNTIKETKSIFAASRPFLLLTTKNSRNLQSSTERLIKQHPRLELGHKGEPCQYSDWSKEKHPHNYLIGPCKGTNRSP